MPATVCKSILHSSSWTDGKEHVRAENKRADRTRALELVYLVLGGGVHVNVYLTCGGVAGNDMVFKGGMQIKTVLATTTAGASVILPMQRVVDLTAERFVRLFLTMFADYNNSISIPEGSTKKAVVAGNIPTNRQYCSQICYLLAVCGLVHNNKLALSFGKCMWFCFAHTDSEGVLDFKHLVLPASSACVHKVMPPEMVTGMVYRVLIQDEAGRTHATTFMGLQEHTEYNKAGKACQELQVSTLAQHYTRCLDTALGAGKIQSWHRTVIIRPSTYSNLGTYNKYMNSHPVQCISPFGTSDFPKPFSSLHPIDRSQTDKDLMYANLMNKLELMHIVWRKHQRAPSTDAEKILPGVQAMYELMNK